MMTFATMQPPFIHFWFLAREVSLTRFERFIIIYQKLAFTLPSLRRGASKTRNQCHEIKISHGDGFWWFKATPVPTETEKTRE